MLLTLMMLPLPLADIPGANAATRKNAARTLLANRASNVATSRSGVAPNQENPADRKSTRLNSSHGYISYAVFCLKKKKKKKTPCNTSILYHKLDQQCH